MFENGALIAASHSKAFGQMASAMPLTLELVNHPDYEIEPADLTMLDILGEGQYGVVHEADWHGTPVAAKLLKDSNDIASQVRWQLQSHTCALRHARGTLCTCMCEALSSEH